MSISVLEFRKIAVTAARCADDKKAEEIQLLDLRKSPISSTDFVLIMSGNSRVHLIALQDAVEETLDKAGLDPVHRDGRNSAQWRVLDYGGLIVHIFHENAREFYSMERLWENASKIHWQSTPKPKPKSKPKTKRK